MQKIRYDFTTIAIESFKQQDLEQTIAGLESKAYYLLDFKFAPENTDIAFVLELFRQRHIMVIGFLPSFDTVAMYAKKTGLMLYAEQDTVAIKVNQPHSSRSLPSHVSPSHHPSKVLGFVSEVLPTKIINRDVEAGEVVSSDGHLLIEGNAYLNSHIEAKGNICVVGSCYGKVVSRDGFININHHRTEQLQIKNTTLHHHDMDDHLFGSSIVAYLVDDAICISHC